MIKTILYKTFNNVIVPPSYNKKMDFGDIDFVIDLGLDNIDIREYINKNFSAK